MRKSLTAVFLALAPVAALTTLAPTAPVQAQQAEVSVSLFYDQLSAHGKWVEHPRWGWVWYPSDVDRDWRPYTRGRWVWTQEYGWYWASYEPFGWAVYHYGRWGYDDEYGWVWVPGSRWAAAWVAFRYSDRAIGWAPLPPDTLQVTGSVRVDEAVITASYYQPRWVFVEARYFVEPQIHARIVPVERNVTYIHETRNVTNITIQNNVFVNRSFEPTRIRAVIGHDVPTVRVQRVDDARRIDIRGHQQAQINTINVFAPQVRISRDQAPPERVRAKEQDKPKVEVKKEAVAPQDRGAPAKPGGLKPEERKGATPAEPTKPGEAKPDERKGATPAQPGQPPRTGEQERRDRTTPGAPPGRQGATPDQERRNRTTPGAPPSGEKTHPGQTPSRTDEDKRGATPAQPPKTSPGAPPSGEKTQPGQRPGQAPSRTDEDKRGAAPAQPAQPPRAAPGAPPTQGKSDEKRGASPAQPAQPPKVAPGAPPSRTQPQQEQRRGQPPAQGDEKKKEQDR